MPPLIIAHRGASHDAPENTLAAFRLAWDQDADGIELDVHLTADGRLACIHDADTGRTGDGGGKKGTGLTVADTPIADLQTTDVGAWKHARFTGETIPTLDAVMAELPADKFVFIEVKSGPESVAPLIDAIETSKVPAEHITVISFHADVVQAFKNARPDIRANWLTSFKQDALLRWQPSQRQVLEQLNASGADGLGCKAQFEVVTPAFARAVRDAGHDLHLWTIDDARDARHAAQLGVASITTNRPDFIRESLSAAKD